MMEHKTFEIRDYAFKADGDGPGTFEGLGAAFGNVDHGGDVILQGAFTDALGEFLYRGFVPVGHDWLGLPIGTIADAKETDDGLYFKAEFHSTQAAQDARTVMRERMERGKFVGLSIGYMADPEGTSFRDDGVRVLSKIKELAEVSFVTVPMNPLAGVTDAKSGPPLSHHYAFSTTALDAVEDMLTRINDLGSLRGKISDANRVRVERILVSATRMARQAQSILDEAEADLDKPKIAPAELYRLRSRLIDIDLLLAEAG